MKALPILITIAIITGCAAAVADTRKNPVEVGHVQWGRDLDAAYRQSAASGKPVLLLFQEVPGCVGVRQFGREVLTHPLIVEAMEAEFIPVLVYNNRSGGQDQKILAHFGEPAWNFQVIRFLDAEGRDVIPRKDRVWTIGGVAGRMVAALAAAGRPIPKYLQGLALEGDTAHHGLAAFAMWCFWTGEFELGKIDGVVATEAGWYEGREVTLVRYHRGHIDLDALARKAARVQCAQKVYASGGEAGKIKGLPTGNFNPANYRKASAADQKKQIQSWQALHQVPGLTAMQLTKINAMAPIDKERALAWLSPRQRKALTAAE